MTAPRQRNDTWTADEDAVIYQAKAKGQCVTDILPLLPNRRRMSITNRMIFLGVRIPQSPTNRTRAPDAYTNAEIRRLCAYIKGDSYIAEYMGVTRAHVAEIRQAIRKPRPAASRKLIDAPATDRDRMGLAPDVAVKIARAASDKLRNAMLALYDREGLRLNLSRVAAMQTLNYGAAAAARFSSMSKGAPNA